MIFDVRITSLIFLFKMYAHFFKMIDAFRYVPRADIESIPKERFLTSTVLYDRAVANRAGVLTHVTEVGYANSVKRRQLF
jgi:hypothetical protein